MRDLSTKIWLKSYENVFINFYEKSIDKMKNLRYNIMGWSFFFFFFFLILLLHWLLMKTLSLCRGDTLPEPAGYKLYFKGHLWLKWEHILLLLEFINENVFTSNPSTPNAAPPLLPKSSGIWLLLLGAAVNWWGCFLAAAASITISGSPAAASWV